jgi:hypothetical protein
MLREATLDPALAQAKVIFPALLRSAVVSIGDTEPWRIS